MLQLNQHHFLAPERPALFSALHCSAILCISGRLSEITAPAFAQVSLTHQFHRNITCRLTKRLCFDLMETSTFDRTAVAGAGY